MGKKNTWGKSMTTHSCNQIEWMNSIDPLNVKLHNVNSTSRLSFCGAVGCVRVGLARLRTRQRWGRDHAPPLLSGNAAFSNQTHVNSETQNNSIIHRVLGALPSHMLCPPLFMTPFASAACACCATLHLS